MEVYSVVGEFDPWDPLAREARSARRSALAEWITTNREDL